MLGLLNQTARRGMVAAVVDFRVPPVGRRGARTPWEIVSAAKWENPLVCDTARGDGHPRRRAAEEVSVGPARDLTDGHHGLHRYHVHVGVLVAWFHPPEPRLRAAGAGFARRGDCADPYRIGGGHY